ncbi:Ribosomal protein L11 methyltransferase [Desulfonema limicola]|uniref:Ribosomal protein L11 methyltransferase n=1 Tax=Desulfonema limicola TaxID=45656 RepID=A0A975GIG1_9BACT|nr:50S ribosomal protein L11 methyltransferase [Desulfonema limicola]QTA82560.1 Ribosomal protein L11 methyltransferase [Desulfonema limicola]
MKWIKTKVVFEIPGADNNQDKELAADLISDIFYQFGLQGVEVENPDMEPEEGWGDDALEKPDFDSVSAYFPKNENLEKKLDILKDRLEHLRNSNKIITRIFFQEIDEQDWAESWKEYFWPQKIGKRIVVKPTWREYLPKPDEIIVEIDPGMAFGTGTHPTTSLCIQMIEKYLHPGDSFLDIGTGSGILLAGGAKLGAGVLWGVDNDETAVDIARKNLKLNNIDPEKFKIIKGNLADLVNQRFDLVTANILSEVILVLLDSISKVLNKNSIFICSGIIVENRDKVVYKMKSQNFEILEVKEQDKWVCITGKKI